MKTARTQSLVTTALISAVTFATIVSRVCDLNRRECIQVSAAAAALGVISVRVSSMRNRQANGIKAN